MILWPLDEGRFESVGDASIHAITDDEVKDHMRNAIQEVSTVRMSKAPFALRQFYGWLTPFSRELMRCAIPGNICRSIPWFDTILDTQFAKVLKCAALLIL